MEFNICCKTIQEVKFPLCFLLFLKNTSESYPYFSFCINYIKKVIDFLNKSTVSVLHSFEKVKPVLPYKVNYWMWCKCQCFLWPGSPAAFTFPVLKSWIHNSTTDRLERPSGFEPPNWLWEASALTISLFRFPQI